MPEMPAETAARHCAKDSVPAVPSRPEAVPTVPMAEVSMRLARDGLGLPGVCLGSEVEVEREDVRVRPVRRLPGDVRCPQVGLGGQRLRGDGRRDGAGLRLLSGLLDDGRAAYRSSGTSSSRDPAEPSSLSPPPAASGR